MIRVQENDFDIAAELARLRSGRTDIGAIVTFTGVTRGTSDGRPLAAMTLEHYPGMTEAELERIEAEARTRWPVDDVLIIHRHGRLVPGDNIVLVATLAAHRGAAFEAAAFLMDYLKTRAPFWKHETLADGEHRWVEARAGDAASADLWTGGANRET